MKTLGRLFPASLGLLISPGDWKYPPPYLPYVLDNGAFASWTHGTEWDPAGFLANIEKAVAWHQKPRWIAVPDVVCDPIRTIENWHEWEPKLRPHGIPLAFVVQDGMDRRDVPPAADVVFVGGSTEWKWETAHLWRAWFRRVHVGRVNSIDRLIECQEKGIESVDGTGWFRGDPDRMRSLIRWIAGTSPRQLRLFVDENDHAETDPL